jgi:hypothetical protein
MCTTSSSAIQALVGLPPLDLVQSEDRASAHRLWGLGSWSYLYPNRGYGRILGGFQQSDPIFDMRVDVMRPIYNFECKCRVVALPRENWISGNGTPQASRGTSVLQTGLGCGGGPAPGCLGNRREGRLDSP